MSHEEWCELMSTMEDQDNIKRAVTQIKKLTTPKAAPENSDSDVSAKNSA